ncbi:MAG: hypothetical protein E6Q97_26280 [Desulfurellales bacterium]|nr:MAG: hypothetical protein E6Q97_26280 [Desulfurellales bacterium]
MAGHGPPPKDPDQRRRRNGPDALTTVTADGKVHGKPLPDTYEWPQATLDWWETWRASALASKFTDTDWSFLVDTAVLHAEFWLGKRSLAGELRLRVAKFGATVEDRARLKVEICEPGKTVAPTLLKSKESQSRKTRLLRAVGDGES